MVNYSEWNGRQLAAGTALSAANVNNTGNGDTMTYNTSGTTATMVTAGDGFDVTSTTSTDIKRLDAAPTAGLAAYSRFYYTPGQTPATGEEVILDIRSAGTRSVSLRHHTTGQVRVGNSATTVIQTGPAFVVGHRYYINCLPLLSASPTTANGRAVVYIKDLTDSTWNTTGDWFYDSGYSQNLGTTNIDQIRFGKTGGGTFTSTLRFERPAWATNSADLSAYTTLATISPFFIPNIYASTNFLSLI